MPPPGTRSVAIADLSGSSHFREGLLSFMAKEYRDEQFRFLYLWLLKA